MAAPQPSRRRLRLWLRPWMAARSRAQPRVPPPPSHRQAHAPRQRLPAPSIPLWCGASSRARMLGQCRTRKPPRPHLVAALAMFRRPCAAPSGFGTRGAARSSTCEVCAAALPRRSSCITTSPSPEAGQPPRKTCACAVGPTMHSRQNRTSGATSCSRGKRGRREHVGAVTRQRTRCEPKRERVPTRAGRAHFTICRRARSRCRAAKPP